MNDFFARQDAARRKSGLLVFHFTGSLIAIICIVYLIVLLTLGGENKRLFIPDLFVGVATITTAILGFGSLYKTIGLRQGGGAVASMMGGELVQTNTRDVLERRLLNVVEEMAIASGIPVPPVYIMRLERGINAFAAGYNSDDAVIGITRGAIESLNRDELQGVIAHEFSHILHGDMRLNIRLIGWVHGILLIHLIGYWVFRISGRISSDSSDGAKVGIPFFLLGLSFMAVGSIGVLFGRMIKSAVSRQREYLADASAVQYTRNPDGIGNALIKIGRVSQHAHITHRRAEEISHMFFGSPFKRMSGLMSTHPPLRDRIQRLLPHFEGAFSPLTPQEIAQVRSDAKAGKRSTPSMLSHLSAPAETREIIADPDEMLELIGAPYLEHVEASKRLIKNLPREMLDAAREPFGSRALVYVLLLDERVDIRTAQLEVLEQHADQPVFEETIRLSAFQNQLTPVMRLPLIDLALGALRALSPPQYERFRANVETLSGADQNITLFEFTLRHILVRHLDASFHKPRRHKNNATSLGRSHKECSVILSMLTRHGHTDEENTARAFHAAAQRMPGIQSHLKLLPADKCTLVGFHHALDHLAKLNFEDKKGILVASLQCVTFDKVLTVTEAELFRAIADALECPMPPWLKLN